MSRLGEKLKQAIDSYVDADVITEELKEVTLKKVLEALDTRRIELLDIVLHLETVIADAANPIGRRHAIQFLAACLRETAQLKMNFKHVETFASFFQGKLHDWQCVEGAVGGDLAGRGVIFENVWMPVMGAFQEKPGVPFQPDAVGFLADLLKARPQDAGPSAKQLQTALQGALGTLLAISPGQNGEEEDTAQLFCAAAELVRRLSLAVGEGSSADAFGALQNALLGSRSGDPGSDSWAKAWRELLSCKPISDPCVGALVQAVCDIVGSQAGRAPGLAELLLQTSPGSAQWLPLALPKLLAHTALSLSEAKLAAGAGGVDELSTKLLQRAAEVFRQRGGRHFEVLAAFAEAFCAAPKAAQPLAAELAQAMGLPNTMPELGEGLTTDLESGSPPSVDTVLQRAEAGRRFLRALCQHLPEDQARLVQRRLLESVALGSHNVLANCAALLPGILPEACGLNWNLCSKTVPAVCRCASGSDPTLAHPAAEAVALEALEALVQSCPEEEVPALLESLGHESRALPKAPQACANALAPRNLRDTFGQLRGVESEQSARGAAVCWASVTVALLRRGSAEQAASFLEALLGALDKESSAVGPFVPTAFRVLAPAKVEATMSSKAKLAPLALQQLSQTVLPSLVSRAKAIGSAGWARRAALESAVSLLAALAPEVACTECSDQMRFCTLTGLKRLKEDEAEASVFSVQVLQLLVRAVERNQPWVEDDLHSVVTPLCDLAGSHRTPLVRLGCFQVLSALIQQAFGHLAPFKKQIQAGCKRGIEDRCREVRLLAVAALNAWHCVGAQT
ncbi:unnamed protein product [Effrenium voratum]|nr:unnamed protein product [Effrenium voratum]